MKFHMNAQQAIIVDEAGTATHRAVSNTLTRRFFAGSTRDLGLLPPAVRWMAADSSAFIVERPPTFHTVMFNTHNDAELKFTIPVPWTVYGLKFKSEALDGLVMMTLNTRPTAINSKYDPLFEAKYPNIFATADNVCFSPELENTQFDTTADAINTCVGGYWSSMFNSELARRLEDKVAEHGSISEYLAHLETRSVEQALEEIGPQCKHTPTMDDLIHLLRDPGPDKPKTTVAYLRDMITRSAA